MFVPVSSWGRGSLRLCQLRVWVGEAVVRGTCRIYQTRPYGSGGCDRWPGWKSEVTPPALERRTLKAWTLLVSPFGRLRARLPCDLTVRPLDPLTYPDADRVLVVVSGVEGRAQGLDGLQVRYDEARKEVTIVSETIDPQVSVEVDAPLKFDLNVKSSGSGHVQVQKIECDNCEIETEQGTSILQSVKGKIVNILDFVAGNITLQSKTGNITIDSSSGCLKASTHQGAIDVYVSQLGEVDLKSHKGSVIIKVPPSLQTHLQLSGKEVDVNSEVHVQEMAEAHKDDRLTVTGIMNEASKHEKWIKADAPKGTVCFRSQSWFQSLKLQD
ncbi:protein FAM185A [Orycteropus afer afer]|uniref:Protein FAM185A n=1 Tax=Orycteropus afer afer TaxID=1230840 RepID=A0A8B7A615_ORYAF|nr:protein FAM185A [Orycteropus afer afer]